MRIVFHRERLPRAIAIGLVSSVIYALLGVAPLAAAGSRVYADSFPVPGSYAESTGPDAWSGPWIEVGDDGLADDGAFHVAGGGHCAEDDCLVIGIKGVDDASISRSFDASAAVTVKINFLYQRHRHGAGAGEVRLLASSDGSTFSLVKTYSLAVDDADQQVESIDISPYASATSAVRFELVGGADGSHLNVDDLSIGVDSGSIPAFNQDLGNRTDPENQSISIDSAATDGEPGALVYTASGLPPGVVIDTDTGLISGVIDFLASGTSPYSVEVKVADGDGNVAVDVFTWTVTNVNRPPSATDRSASVLEDDSGGVTIDLENTGFVSDADGDPVTLAALDLSGLVGGSVTDNGDGTVTYSPNTDFDGTDSFSYTVTDGSDVSAPATVTITVTGTDDDPTLTAIPPIAVAEGALAAFTADADDPDTGDSIFFTLVSGPDPVPGGAGVNASGDFTWLTDEADGPGSYAFKLRVTDATNRYVEQTVLIDVSEANQAPILDSIADQTDTEGDIVSLAMVVTDGDIPAPEHTFSIGGLPPGLSYDSATGTISGVLAFTAAAGSPYSVTVTVQDDHAPPGVDAESFLWTVADTNRPPTITAVPSNATLSPGDPYSAAVAATDPDGDPFGYSASGLPTGVAIDGGSGLISGTVDSGVLSGSYVVDVSVTDSGGAVASASFVITISSPPPPPPTTTTTTAPPTTTTVPPTTTTLPPPSTTTTPMTTTTLPPVPLAATTTTAPEPPTPTTVVEPPSVTTTTVAPVLPTPVTTQVVSEPTTETTVMTRDRARDVKDGLIVSGSVDVDPPAGAGRSQLSPREGLTVSFRSAVESLQSQFVSAALLGMGVAILLLLGVDRREPEDAVRPATA